MLRLSKTIVLWMLLAVLTASGAWANDPITVTNNSYNNQPYCVGNTIYFNITIVDDDDGTKDLTNAVVNCTDNGYINSVYIAPSEEYTSVSGTFIPYGEGTFSITATINDSNNPINDPQVVYTMVTGVVDGTLWYLNTPLTGTVTSDAPDGHFVKMEPTNYVTITSTITDSDHYKCCYAEENVNDPVTLKSWTTNQPGSTLVGGAGLPPGTWHYYPNSKGTHTLTLVFQDTATMGSTDSGNRNDGDKTVTLTFTVCTHPTFTSRVFLDTPEDRLKEIEYTFRLPKAGSLDTAYSHLTLRPTEESGVVDALMQFSHDPLLDNWFAQPEYDGGYFYHIKWLEGPPPLKGGPPTDSEAYADYAEIQRKLTVPVDKCEELAYTFGSDPETQAFLHKVGLGGVWVPETTTSPVQKAGLVMDCSICGAQNVCLAEFLFHYQSTVHPNSDFIKEGNLHFAEPVACGGNFGLIRTIVPLPNQILPWEQMCGVTSPVDLGPDPYAPLCAPLP